MQSSPTRAGLLLLTGALIAGFAVGAPLPWMHGVVNGLTRLGAVAAVACFFVGVGLLLVRRRRALRAFVVLSATAGLVVGLAPVRTSRAALQAELAVAVRAYEGVPYVWGGESVVGIDCSGLPRSARRTAAVTLAWRNLDPGLLRFAARDWLVDVPAKGMLAGTGTERVAAADRAGLLPKSALTPGTLVNTADGSHVMVVLDEDTLIEADPLPNKVIVARVDDLTNPWMTTPVVAVRFTAPR